MENRDEFPSAVKIFVGTVLVLYVTLSVLTSAYFGTWLLDKTVAGSVTNAFSNTPVVVTINVSIALHLISALPVIFNPVALTCERFLGVERLFDTFAVSGENGDAVKAWGWQTRLLINCHTRCTVIILGLENVMVFCKCS